MKNKKVLSLRTKAEVILVACFFIALSAWSVVSVTRTITDSSDTIETRIKISNGNLKEALGSNIQLSVWDGNSSDTLKVVVPPGKYKLPNGIKITRDNIILEGYGAFLEFEGNNDDSFITVGGTASANNVSILGFSFDGSNQTVNDVGGQVGIEWTKDGCGILIDDEDGVGTKNTLIRDCYFVNIPNEGVGIYADSDMSNVNLNTRIESCTFERIGFRGVHPHLDHWVSVVDCTFKNMDDWAFDAGIIPEGFEFGVRHSHIISGCTFLNFTDGAAIYGGSSNILGSIINKNDFVRINGTCVIKTWNKDIISDNYFRECSADIVIFVETGTEVLITDNVFFNCGKLNYNMIKVRGENTTISGNRFENFYCKWNWVIAIHNGNINIINNKFKQDSDAQENVDSLIRFDDDNKGSCNIMGNDFDVTKALNTGAISYHASYTGVGNIIKDNSGLDNSTYEYIPCSGSSPYSSPDDGATYFCTTNQTLSIYWDGREYYFDHNG